MATSYAEVGTQMCEPSALCLPRTPCCTWSPPQVELQRTNVWVKSSDNYFLLYGKAFQVLDHYFL